jgi:hypothetical protein
MINTHKGVFMITSRICTTCKIEKPFEEFGNSKKGKWGKREICKPCKRIKDREYERANTDKMTAKHDRWVKKNAAHLADYRHKRYEENPEPYKARAIEYRKSKKNEPVKKYKYKYPHKKKAHLYVELAVHYGHLIRPDRCSKCGVECKPQGHHHDYDLPLDVTWLCTKCHGFEHRINHAERLSEKTSKEEAIV